MYRQYVLVLSMEVTGTHAYLDIITKSVVSAVGLAILYTIYKIITFIFSIFSTRFTLRHFPHDAGHWLFGSNPFVSVFIL